MVGAFVLILTTAFIWGMLWISVGGPPQDYDRYLVYMMDSVSGLNVDAPYPLTRPFDAQRKAAQKSTDTLYCYDVPALFEAAVEQQWVGSSSSGGIEGGIRAAARPLMVMYTTELVVQKKSGVPGDWTMEDYLHGDLELHQIHRGAGANDVGMVAWLMVLKTVEYPNVRWPFIIFVFLFLHRVC